MRVRRLSADVEDLLGDPPDVLLHTPLVERLHRDDVAAFLLGLGRAVAEDQGSAMHVRFRHANGDYVGVRFVVTPTSGDPGTRLGIVMTAESSELTAGRAPRRAGASPVADRARGAGGGRRRRAATHPGSLHRFPGSTTSRPRQWDIVTRLLKGERVPDIARAMFVSQSTVRNQLGTIYRKVGVHSQSELLALLRGEQGQSV